MGNKKIIIAIIIVVILIIGLIVTSFLYNKFNNEQLNTLTEESNKLLQMDLATEEIDEQIKTEKDFGEVEKAIKEYLQELKNIYVEIEKLNEEIDVEEIFSAQNIEDQNFDDVDAIINDYREKSKSYVSQYDELITETKIAENIDKRNLKPYYVDLYNTVMLGDVMKNQYTTLGNDIEDCKDKIYDKLNVMGNIKDFLVKRENYWSIKEGKIIFTNTNVMTEYYNLINQIED